MGSRLLSRLKAASLLRTYFVTSKSPWSWELGGKEGNSRLGPPVGFDIIATVTVLVELVRAEDVGAVVLTFMADVLDAPVVEVA